MALQAARETVGEVGGSGHVGTSRGVVRLASESTVCIGTCFKTGTEKLVLHADWQIYICNFYHQIWTCMDLSCTITYLVSCPLGRGSGCLGKLYVPKS